MTTFLHAIWTGRRLCVWGESAQPVASGAIPALSERSFDQLTHTLADLATGGDQVDVAIRVPLVDARALPCRRAQRAGAGIPDPLREPTIGRIDVPALAFHPAQASAVLEGLEDRAGSTLVLDDDFVFYASLSRLARRVLAEQRFIPMLRQSASGTLSGAWLAWTADNELGAAFAAIVRSMPPAARASVDEFGHDGAAIASDFLSWTVDALCRAALEADGLSGIVDGRPLTDPHVAWLSGLLGQTRTLPVEGSERSEMTRRVRAWIAGLEDRGAGAGWRLRFALDEPAIGDGSDADVRRAAWPLKFQLQCVDRPALVIDAADLWHVRGRAMSVDGQTIEGPQDVLLRELARAMKLYSRLESALESATPSSITLTTQLAYDFLREVRPVLLEQGFGVQAPAWWEAPGQRLGVRLRLESGELPGAGRIAGADAAMGPASRLGLGSLVRYRWDLAIGDAVMSLAEFEKLAQQKSPLVRVNGRWIEVRPEDIRAAMQFVREHPGGEMSVGDALRTVYDAGAGETGVPVVGVEATGWLESLLSADSGQSIEPLETPKSFKGTLRPYQARGLSWLAFVERVGLGACLADDMGLGKTIQLLALLAHERETATPDAPVGPTLLIAPTSVVSNWVRETQRFCPHFTVVVHHGPERATGDAFLQVAASADIVITTYSLSARDQEHFERVRWHRVVLDEAQFIKNAWTKQTQAVRAVDAPRRVALTGTPVENRLAELWSIVDFLNPSYLGSSASFRRRFAVPIERSHNRHRADQLRGLIRPFVLRRVKSDPTVIADLPEKIETHEYCHLTSEQASQYEAMVKSMLTRVEEFEGTKRRGVVLAGLIRLKQICNHPAQIGIDAVTARHVDAARSGKCVRLLAMLEEVIAEGAQSLVFTQFKQMGSILAPMISQRFDREVLFLHGGVPQDDRAKIVERFQNGGANMPVLVLSLRAGGVGLNLTAATHVFHFDRWWNPAVENQATDRAYRIGQTRTVQVHKFVVRGTLEERIDAMIEQKSGLATSIIGAGERWLTDLSTDQLRSILELRQEAVDDD